MILAGDVGGTNARLAVFDNTGSSPKPVTERVFPSQSATSLSRIVQEFIATLPPGQRAITRAAFGIAGPVSGGRVKLTNLPWPEVTESELAGVIGVDRAYLINDLVAHAESIDVIDASRIAPLIDGKADPSGNRAILAAGTGLGEAAQVYDRHQKRYISFPTEGGHSDFSPRNDLEVAFAAWLRSSGKPTHWEGALSGPGLRNLYDFLSTTETPSPPARDPKQIGEEGLSGRCPVAARALDWFVSLYGAEAGNLALKTLATGGVYIAGGIARQFKDRLASQAFAYAFHQHGPAPIRSLLMKIPVYLIDFDHPGLYGAANYARNH